MSKVEKKDDNMKDLLPFISTEHNVYPMSFIFFHITKIGGTTLKKITSNQYEEVEIYLILPFFSLKNPFVTMKR